MPQKYEENPQLGEWVIEQRKQMRKGGIKEERMQKLNELGFEWDGRRVQMSGVMHDVNVDEDINANIDDGDDEDE